MYIDLGIQLEIDMSEERKVSLTDLTVTVIRTIKRNFRLFVSVILFFTLLGVIYSLVKQKEYKTHFTAYSSILKNEHPSHIYEALNVYVKEGQAEKLSELLQIDVETARAIRKIKANKTEGITEKDRIPIGMPRFEVNLFTVEIRTSNPVDYVALQKGCYYYLANTSFVKSKIKYQKERIKNSLALVDSQLVHLNNAQKEMVLNLESNRQRPDKSLTVIGSEVAYPNGMIELIKYREGLEKSLETSVPMVVVQDIIQTNKPISEKLLIWAVSLGIGLVLSLLALFFREILNKA
ncbi:MAG: hypothetical protein CL840_13020 [Crocinitomicaceae bacterium]|nr:hypothetical protein [Crocinitomicaceae bacterium]|tara:strand:+ start:18142 stop:19020 length:879 start_codon:yes stop_codon:yes gene_type:complete